MKKNDNAAYLEKPEKLNDFPSRTSQQVEDRTGVKYPPYEDNSDYNNARLNAETDYSRRGQLPRRQEYDRRNARVRQYLSRGGNMGYTRVPAHQDDRVPVTRTPAGNNNRTHRRILYR